MHYVLRTCNHDMTSYNGFKWPKRGKVVAPDWNPEPVCGEGLHGFLNGEGESSLANWDGDAKWLVVKTDKYVDLNGKVKFKQGSVVYAGDRMGATALMAKHCPNARVIGRYVVSDETLNVIGGDRSTLTGGYYSKLTGGYYSTLTGGYWSTLTSGNWSTLAGGDRSTLTGGVGSTLTGGRGSTLTGGRGSTLTGERGSTLTGGVGSTLTGGDNSTLTWKIFGGARYRLHTVYVGENGIKPNTPYVFKDGKICELEKS